MNTLVVTLSLVIFSPAQAPAGKDAGREPHPLAPSLPLLTEKEQEAIEKVIQRFIEADVGKLKGAAAAKAMADFNKLGPEAIPALLDGLNEAANLEHSCPAVLIARKLARMFGASEDRKLLDFARDMIGAGVTAKRHTVVLKDLKLTCQLRMAELQRRELIAKKSGKVGGGAGDAGKPPKALTVAELSAIAGSERGPKLREALIELEKRSGEGVVKALAAAATRYEGDMQKLARDLLTRHLGRQGPEELKTFLQDERAEVRRAAAAAIGAKGLRLVGELIEVLTDKDREVRQAARQSLVQMTRRDFGPEASASDEEAETAAVNWRNWWQSQRGK